jgi:ketosteroid isomerase-like protein
MPTAPADPSIAEAIVLLHAAMEKVANGDISAITVLHSHADDATSYYGWGGYEVGWAAVAKRWEWAGQQFQGGSVSYQPLTVVAGGDLFYTTEIETFRVRVAGRPQSVEWTNRVTHVFRREDGVWRLLHRHANRLEAQHRPADRFG